MLTSFHGGIGTTKTTGIKKRVRHEDRYEKKEEGRVRDKFSNLTITGRKKRWGGDRNPKQNNRAGRTMTYLRKISVNSTILIAS